MAANSLPERSSSRPRGVRQSQNRDHEAVQPVDDDDVGAGQLWLLLGSRVRKQRQ